MKDVEEIAREITNKIAHLLQGTYFGQNVGEVEHRITAALRSEREKVERLEKQLSEYSHHLTAKVAGTGIEGATPLCPNEKKLEMAREKFQAIIDCHHSCEQPTEQEEREVHKMFHIAERALEEMEKI